MKYKSILFNRVHVQGNELKYVQQSIKDGHISGDGSFTMKCDSLLEKELNVNKSILTLLRQAFDLIATYTVIPIQIIGLTGILFFIVGIFLFLYVMYFRLFVGTQSSLISFIAILILLSGISLFSIVVISEYSVRLYKEVRKMPLYILKDSDINNLDRQ